MRERGLFKSKSQLLMWKMVSQKNVPCQPSDTLIAGIAEAAVDTSGNDLMSARPTVISASKNIFQLIPRTYSCFYRHDVSVAYSPSPKTASKNKSEEGSVEEVVCFYQDRRHWTSGFMLMSDRKRVDENEVLLKERFQRKVKEALEMCSDKPAIHPIMVPCPSSNKNCFICSCSYEDYLSHIESPEHRVRSRGCIGMKYIRELISTRYPRKAKPIAKSRSHGHRKPGVLEIYQFAKHRLPNDSR